MVNDILSQFYTSLNLPLHEKVEELTRIIDQSTPSKDLQTLFPELISNIFSNTLNNGWGLRTITYNGNTREFMALMAFFEPLGPMFRLCYKLLLDPQLKYNVPLNVLPLDLQMSFERGRFPQFYSDMLVTDPLTLRVVALALNPFDYYIFNFALHLVSNSQQTSSWENRCSAYFALACDYFVHFLPADPNTSVLPHIPNYTGKVPIAAPLQTTTNRPLYFPSLLLIPDLSGSMRNQHTTTQNPSTNEFWRSETVLQFFIDIWMNVSARNVEAMMFQRNHMIMSSSPEHVGTLRVLVKHLHAFSAKHMSDPAVRSSALRKYARQLMCVRAYHYIKHLVITWPLDGSFKLVMELWLSFIQPWRYVNNNIFEDRSSQHSNQGEDKKANKLDSNFIQFIAENFPSYTCIFTLVVSRFMRLDPSDYQNAIMLFRLGKVFAQQHLCPILWNLEKAITDSATSLSLSSDTSYNNSGMEQSYNYNGISLHKWAKIARQSLLEFNLSANFEYQPVWGENMRLYAFHLLQRIVTAKTTVENNIEEYDNIFNLINVIDNINLRNKDIWGSIKVFLNMEDGEKAALSKVNKLPHFLSTSFHNFSYIFGFNTPENPLELVIKDNSMDCSLYDNSVNLLLSITYKLRSKPTNVQYMGDPDLMPITTYESTILVKILYQIASSLNEMFGAQFAILWNRNDLYGYMAREVLQSPRTIQTYVKDGVNHKSIVSQQLPARLSLRNLGTYAFVIWISIGYIIFKMLSYSGSFYVFVLIIMWLMLIFIKASLKMLRLIENQDII